MAAIHHQGYCATSQPGIPEQVTQHLNLLRLENLMAPRWSIILNEHGCQLQVYWRAPNAPEKDVPCNNTAEAEVPPPKKARKQDLGTPRSNGTVNGTPGGPIRPVALGPNGHMRRPMATAAVRTNPQFLGRPPSSPKFPAAKPTPTLHGSSISPPTKITIPTQATLIGRTLEQLSPKSNFTAPSPTVNSTPSTSAMKVPENKRTSTGRAPGKSIEATAAMLLEDRLSFSNNGLKMMSSPPEFDTPPGSERSLSGDGKETNIASAAACSETEQTQKALEFAMNDMYRQKFSCEICHKTFTRKYSLSRHYKEVHQGESRSSKFQASLGPSLLSIANERGLVERSLNDFGVPSLSRVQFPAPLSTGETDVKIEDLSQEDDDMAPSMVVNRSNPSSSH